METLKIALLQIAPCGTLEGNLEKGIKHCRKVKEPDADSEIVNVLVCRPKSWIKHFAGGYYHGCT